MEKSGGCVRVQLINHMLDGYGVRGVGRGGWGLGVGGGVGLVLPLILFSFFVIIMSPRLIWTVDLMFVQLTGYLNQTYKDKEPTSIIRKF